MQWPRAGQCTFDFNHEEIRRPAFELHHSHELRQERKRVALDQHIIADFALDGEACSRSVKLGSRTELDAAARQGKVGFAANARVVTCGEVDGDPFQLGEVRGRVERRMQAAHGQSEVWRRRPLQPQRHIARQHELLQQP